jgi:hypothetical protein
VATKVTAPVITETTNGERLFSTTDGTDSTDSNDNGNNGERHMLRMARMIAVVSGLLILTVRIASS